MIVDPSKKLLEIATLAAKLDATERAGQRLKECLAAPPEYGKITLCFQNGKLFRVVKEES